MPPELFNFSDFARAFHSYPWWQVAIEWLLIGTVVYWVVRFLRGTRGARLLKGIVFLLLALYLIVTLVGDRFGLQQRGEGGPSEGGWRQGRRAGHDPHPSHRRQR